MSTGARAFAAIMALMLQAGNCRFGRGTLPRAWGRGQDLDLEPNLRHEGKRGQNRARP